MKLPLHKQPQIQNTKGKWKRRIYKLTALIIISILCFPALLFLLSFFHLGPQFLILMEYFESFLFYYINFLCLNCLSNSSVGAIILFTIPLRAYFWIYFISFLISFPLLKLFSSFLSLIHPKNE